MTEVVIEGTLIESVDGWSTVEILTRPGTNSPFSLRIVVPDSTVVPAARKTPGQRAYDAWAGEKRIGGPMPWDALHQADQSLWETIADAARGV